jgi:hypothetical protein
MSKRLQVLLDEEEFDAIRQAADNEGLTVSEWVRQVLRRARRESATGDRSRKLATIRAAVRHDFPTSDIDEMIQEIERGYRDR